MSGIALRGNMETICKCLRLLRLEQVEMEQFGETQESWTKLMYTEEVLGYGKDRI